jgi:hypothetical protein
MRFLDAAIACFKAHRVVVQRVMTDNGSAFRSGAFAKLKQPPNLPGTVSNSRKG